jgi:hypothetical protein
MKKYLVYVCLGFLLFGCEETNDPLRDTAESCENTVCTLNFVYLTFNVEDANGQPVELGSHQVIDKASGTDITSKLDTQTFEKGTYIYYDDGMLQGNQNTAKTIIFKGFGAEQQLLFTEEYEVAIDCCHVAYVSGPLTVTLP